VENIVTTIEPANRNVEVTDSPVKAANPTFEPANATVESADSTFEVSHPPAREFNPPVEQPNPTVEPADAAATKLNSPLEAADLTVQVSYPQVQRVKTTSGFYFFGGASRQIDGCEILQEESENSCGISLQAF
jgi:hypothetical protein